MLYFLGRVAGVNGEFRVLGFEGVVFFGEGGGGVIPTR